MMNYEVPIAIKRHKLLSTLTTNLSGRLSKWQAGSATLLALVSCVIDILSVNVTSV